MSSTTTTIQLPAMQLSPCALALPSSHTVGERAARFDLTRGSPKRHNKNIYGIMLREKNPVQKLAVYHAWDTMCIACYHLKKNIIKRRFDFKLQESRE